MLVKIGEIVRQVALIALLAAFLEMLLPEKKMTRYVRLVLGLFVVVAILTPLVEGLRFGPELDVTAWDLRLDPVAAAPVQQGREMARANEEAALEIYRDRLAGQIKALVSLVPGVKQAEVLVSLTGDKEHRGAIRRVVITATLAGPETAKGGGDAPPPPAGNLPPKITAAEVQQIKSRIVAMITHFYGLEPGRVEVRIYGGVANGQK
ncbi:Sporulation stage III, protein AF [Moorella glycerini]|uniref:Stage III sporulation protein AF n=1 Tax=Neomoorella stamsii TaxID=1266720 RepID=A0A9X7J228_9FIRM|nr:MULTISPECIES: stage III sporulation protein AF [Moorella]PRR71837.1 Stage III sporulation protein AF [Moorella stamsii]CEP66055.1 Sporulation stage III, protein AF [Moorella glycerini]